MIFIWRGWGLLVPCAFIISGVISISIFETDNATSNLMIYMFAAVFCFAFNILVKKYRDKSCEFTTLVNPKTGKEQKQYIKHYTNKKTGETYQMIIKDTFFGLPIFAWIFISLLLGIISFIVN